LKAADSPLPLRWNELPSETRNNLRGKLRGLWNAPDDERAFNDLSLDKQQALMLLERHLSSKDLWQAVRRIHNIYGSGGVGIDFEAWPYLESRLSQRKDFTRRFAKRKSVRGGFYERGRRNAVLHFLSHEGNPPRWHVHFDLYNPVFSPMNFLRHLRHEHFGTLRPDWRLIQNHFK
jgi:hypothetical protein